MVDRGIPRFHNLIRGYQQSRIAIRKGAHQDIQSHLCENLYDRLVADQKSFDT
jgi:hypothetical protein